MVQPLKTKEIYQCACCKEYYSDKENALRCCSGLSRVDQDNLWEICIDEGFPLIICPHDEEERK